MAWTEREVATGKEVDVTAAKAQMLDEVKKASMPIVQKESEGGVRPFDTVKFQPVKGVGTFEAEFGIKGDDVIFHIWPYGYHDADRKEGQVLPKFIPAFEATLKTSFTGTVFTPARCDFSFDGDLGAWFVRAKGYSQNQFFRQLSIEALTYLHKNLGGSEG